MHVTLALFLSLGLAAAPVATSATKVDPGLPAYKPAANLSGALSVGGSDSLDPAVQLWLNGFHALHPNVTVKSTSQGSSAGYLCLLEGTCAVGTMSREMTKEELSSFEAKHGYRPTKLVAAVGAMGFFVHASNPLAAISVEQVDAIYSIGRKAGLKDPITTWGQLGLSGDWGARKISPYSEGEHSGTRAFFRERVLLKGELRPGVTVQADPQSVIEAVSLAPTSIAYGSLHFANSMVKVLPVSSGGGAPVAPSYDAIMRGDYSLVRFYYLYVSRPTGKPLAPATLAFLQYAFSREGQAAVAAVGLMPVPADMAAASLARLR